MKSISMLSLILSIFCNLAFPQDVGMGTRAGSGDRFEAEYTLNVETPHVKWAKPLPGGAIRLLAIPSVRAGRTLVELAQRLSLDLTTVSIDPAWDTNKWTMSFGKDYGARAERGDLKLIYGYLEEELTGSEPFDVILLPLNHGWEALTPASIEALKRRVRNGCGLVLVRPFENDISPLRPSDAIEPDDRPYREVEPSVEQSPWHRTSAHYVTRAIPVETFPFQFIQNYKYEAVKGAEVLISTESGTPVAATHNYGQGRVVAFGFQNVGLSWQMGMEARIGCPDIYWEYFYALLCRALIFAADREPERVPSFDDPETEWQLKREDGQVVDRSHGPAPDFEGLPPGRYFLEQRAASDWKVTTVEVPQTERIEALTVKPAVVAENETITVQFAASGGARVELLDSLNRVLAQKSTSAGGDQSVTLNSGNPLVHSGQVRVSVGTAREQIPVQFAASTRKWNDYEVILPWSGPGSYQPWIPALDEQFRRIGVTTLSRPDRNFRVIASAHLAAFGIYWYRRASYEERKAAFLETGDKSQITRNVSLQNPNFDQELREQLQQRTERMLALRPFAYYLADESSLTAYADAFDVDWSPEALDGFRDWLLKEYGSLEKLNHSWNTSFREWEGVVPMTTEEAQRHGNYAAWSDHRVYMEQEFIKAIATACRVTKELDPGGRASFSGTQIPAPHNGCNWYEIDQIIDYLQPYSGGDQDAMHYLFNPELLLSGFTGYGVTGAEAHHQVWRRLFYGHSGASIFWHYTLLNPDLTFSEQGAALAAVFGKIQSGIGRVFMNSEVVEDGVAIHFSMASIRGAWITDGKIRPKVISAQRTSENFAELMKRRTAWVEELERRGIQFRFLATPQIEAGELANYKELILPYSIAISDREAEEIERFVANGGTVRLDEQAGKMDERCRWRNVPLWAGGKEGFIVGEPGDIGIKRSIQFDRESLTTVRGYGESELLGILPEKSETVTLPPPAGVRYDLFEGGLAASVLDLSPERPLLLLERKSRISSFELREDLKIFLKDDSGNPVDRTVVAVQVFAPNGKLVRHYSGNLDILQGRGQFHIPFALNDASGTWRVRARDVISGLVAERTIQRAAEE